LGIAAGALSMIGLVSAGQAWAACEPQEGPRFTSEIADRFMRNPAKILGQDTSTYGLTVFVMQFSAARSRNLDVFRSMLPRADRLQKAAIGLGFARAVTFCQLADGPIAQRIANWVTKLPVHEVVSAYQQAMATSDGSNVNAPVDMAAPKVENRFGGGLSLVPPPSAAGVGSLAIPDPMSLPGD
jgi:hypothetical protein